MGSLWERAKHIARSRWNALVDAKDKAKEAGKELRDALRELDGEKVKQRARDFKDNVEKKAKQFKDSIEEEFKKLKHDKDKIAKSYEILGLDPLVQTKDMEVLQKQKRDLLKKYHPDNFPNDEKERKRAERKSKDITEAFSAIKEHLEKIKKFEEQEKKPDA
jgi:urocanate hydratase